MIDATQAAEYLSALAPFTSLNREEWRIGYAALRTIKRDWATTPGLNNLPGYSHFTQFCPAAPHQIEPRSTKLWSKLHPASDTQMEAFEAALLS